jgi:hypothetical protein
MTNEINFYLQFEPDKRDKGRFPEPKKSSQFMPDWYKKIKAYPNEKDLGTMKSCIPFRDAMCVGYIIPLWQDIAFFKQGHGPSGYTWKYTNDWNHPPEIDDSHSIAAHSEYQTENTPLHEKNQCRNALKFDSPWIIETPPGYSCLIVQPMNHSEDRFQISSAIVDTDMYKIPVTFPFIVTTFRREFYLERGTPIAQIIPFKREDWCSKVGYSDEKIEESTKQRKILSEEFVRSYQKHWWEKKSFK